MGDIGEPLAAQFFDVRLVEAKSREGIDGYSGAKLDTMLEQAASDYINHPRGFVLIDGKLRASSIYNWYASDWGTQEDTLTMRKR